MCQRQSIHFGCSHCLAVAIESHNLSLVDELLRRAYRDMFWALIPATWRSYYRSIPMRISEDEHLTLVGQPNCGHENFDMDLCTPILSAGLSTQILVSLPILAQWHSCAGFPVVCRTTSARIAQIRIRRATILSSACYGGSKLT